MMDWQWWNMAKQIQNVSNQEELNLYNDVFKKAYKFNFELGIRNFRNSVFWVRFYSWLYQVNWIKSFKDDFHPFIPGLEMKYAIEEAQNLNSQVRFGGLAITEGDLLSLKVPSHHSPTLRPKTDST